MAKCEFIDLTLSDSDSDGDFIQSKKATHLFLYQASVYYKCLLHQVSTTVNGNNFTGFVHVRSKYCSLAKSAGLICIICQKLEVSLRDATKVCSVQLRACVGSPACIYI